MYTIRIPKIIKYGKDALSETEYPKNALVVTTAPPEVSGKWLARMGIKDYLLYDKVEPEPSIETVQKVISEYKKLVTSLGGEIKVLTKVSLDDIAKISGSKVAEGVDKDRRGDLVIDPGYDGVYGVVKIWDHGKEQKEETGVPQLGLFD